MTSQIILQNVKFLTEETRDILIEDGFIKDIAESNSLNGQHIINCSGAYVTSGWIDLHVHAFSKHHPYGDQIDEIGYKQGVTTIVDAGSCGTRQIEELINDAKKAKTNVLSFLNISEIGLKRIDELSSLDWINDEKITDVIKKHSDFIVGLKARMSKSVIGENGIIPLKKARDIADQVALPIMVHIGSSPPFVEEVLDYLKEGDIVTHYLNGKGNGLLDSSGVPKKVFLEAIERGVLLDVGHGSASFSFRVAEQAKKQQIHFDTISTDIYRENRLHGPVYSMAHTLTKFLCLGYSLSEIIRAVTETPAHMIKRPDLGRIRCDSIANMTLFTLDEKPITLEDSDGEKRMFNKQITVQGVVINGEFISTKT